MPQSTVQLSNTKAEQGIYPAYQKFVVSLDNIQGLFYQLGVGFVSPENRKYLLEVSINGTVVVTLKAPPNEYDRANFQIEKIFQDYLSTDVTPFYLDGTNTEKDAIHNILSVKQNKSTLIQVDLRGGEEYEINGVLSTILRDATEQTHTSGIDKKFFVYNGTRQHVDGNDASFILDHQCSSNTGKLLTDALSTFLVFASLDDVTTDAQLQKIRTNDYACIAAFNRNHHTHLNTWQRVQYTFFDSNENMIDNPVLNNVFEDVADTFGMTQRTGLVWIPTGMQNFRDMAITSDTNLDNTAFYSIMLENDSNAVKSKSYFFKVIDDDCKGFETLRLAWVNSFGTWDYYNFNKKSTQSFNSKRSTYEQQYGYRQDSDTYGYSYSENTGGTQVLTNTVKETIEANTDFITEQEADFLKHCFTSPNVQMQVGTGNTAEWVGVVITESEYIKQTSANDKVIQYIITVEKSHNYRVQREG
jgi:hypothetical protein